MTWQVGMHGTPHSLHGKHWTVWLEKLFEHDPSGCWRARFSSQRLQTCGFEDYGRLFAPRYFYDLERAKLECEEWARFALAAIGWADDPA